MTGPKKGFLHRMCAVCHVDFPYPHSTELIWCRKDEFYVCRRCWETNCKEGHAMGRLNKGSTMADTVKASLFLLFLILPCGLAAFYDPVVTTQWNGMPFTDTGSLPEDGTVKVFGTLKSIEDVALGGHEDRLKNGYAWNWNDTDIFFIDDGTGAVRVVVEDYYEISPALRRAPNAPNTGGTAYYPGDNATVVAEVHTESGSKVLHLRFIGPEKATKPFEVWMFPLMVATLLPSTYIIFKLVKTIRHRNRRHAEAVQNALPGEVPRDRARKPEGLDWLAGPPKGSRLGPITLGILFFVFAVFFLDFLWSVHLPCRKWDIITFALASGSMADIILGGVIFIDLRFDKPPDVSLDKTGIFFWHESPYRRSIDPNFVAWGDIKEIEHPTRKSELWVITRKNHEVISLTELDDWVVDRIREEWKKKQKAPEPGTIGTSPRTGP